MKYIRTKYGIYLHKIFEDNFIKKDKNGNEIAIYDEHSFLHPIIKQADEKELTFFGI